MDMEIPLTAPRDAVMASPAESQAVRDWAGQVFAGFPAEHEERRLHDAAPPFSFVYDGIPSAQLLPGWTRTIASKEDTAAVEHLVRWTDPRTGLAVSAQVKVFKRHPAVDWVLHFENTGAQDTRMIVNVQFGAQGVITTVGWSGQWAAAFVRETSGPTRLTAGMELTHLILHPGDR